MKCMILYSVKNRVMKKVISLTSYPPTGNLTPLDPFQSDQRCKVDHSRFGNGSCWAYSVQLARSILFFSDPGLLQLVGVIFPTR